MTPADTIAALSSAAGPAARMVVRASGPAAHDLARALCPALRSSGPLAPGSAVRHPLQFADLSVPAWLYLFTGPRSYTGQDVVEFHLPGNPLLARLLLEELIRLGARQAEAGEFTARAYFNGRLDLSEAEGVAATIAAASEGELRAARQLLAGELARRLTPVMDSVAQTLALIEVGIDFSDEDVTFLAADEVARRVGDADGALEKLVSESARFERLAHEPRAVLAGRPNAGKSTLLNALAGRERAAVSPAAGTTRDALSAEIALARGLVVLVDVAGLDDGGLDDGGLDDGGLDDGGLDDSPSPATNPRDPAADVARQMRRRALAEIEAADLILLVHDAADPLPPLRLPREPDLIVRTKIDLPGGDRAVASQSDRCLTVSARTGEHLPALRARLDALAFGGTSDGASLALNARHLRALADARAALERAGALVATGAAELVALELREALDALGQILGTVTPDDLLGKIFAKFCIGK